MKEFFIKILGWILKFLKQEQEDLIIKEIQDHLLEVKLEAHSKVISLAEETKENIYYAIDNVVKDKANKIKFVAEEFIKIDKFGLIPNAVTRPIYDISNHIDDHIELARKQVEEYIDGIKNDMLEHIDKAQSDDAVNTLVTLASDRFREQGEAFINKLITKYTI